MIIYETLTAGYENGPGEYEATGSVTWADLATSPYGNWTNWTTYNPTPNSIVLEVEVDTEVVGLRTPLATIDAEGTVSLELKITSSTTVDSNGVDHGTFGGEETTVTFAGSEYTYVAGRYYLWTVTISGDATTPLPRLKGYAFTFNDERISEYYAGVDTSTLTGTIDARVVSTNLGVVDVLVATAVEGGTTHSPQTLQDRHYVVPDDYAFQSAAITTNIVSKSPPTIRSFDMNNESIDCEVDIYLQGMPKIQQSPQGVVTA